MSWPTSPHRSESLHANCQSGSAEGKFLKFDGKGDKLAVTALEGTDKKDNISVKVDGKVDGGNIAVASLNLT